MRGPQTNRAAQVIITRNVFILKLRRGHYELTGRRTGPTRAAVAFAQLASAI
jgi:hypothetical protein